MPDKGITPVVAVIMLLLIVIAVVGGTYTFIRRTMRSTQNRTSQQIQHKLGQITTSFRIASVSGNKIYLRNTGTGPLDTTKLGVYVDGKRVSFQDVGEIGSGKVDSLKMSRILVGKHKVKVTSTLKEGVKTHEFEDKRIVLFSGTVSYGTMKDNTKILRNGEVVVNAPTSETGSFSVSQGDIISSNKPVGLKGTGHLLPPITGAGTRHAYWTTRSEPHTIYIYAPSSSAETEVYVDEYQDGSPYQTVTIPQGEIRTVSISGDDHTIRLYSTSPVVAAAHSSGSDRVFLPPTAQEILHTMSEHRIAMKPGTSINNNDPYFNGNGVFGSYQLADGCGGDSDMGMPVKMLGSTYIVPHEVDDFALATVEPNTIHVYEWTGSSFSLYQEYDFSDASRSNPRQVEVDDQSGPCDSGQDLNPPVLVNGTAPFYLRTNDQGSDEYPAVGYLLL